ncbi:MAG: DUF4276 family protein [Chloroflexota bacterium]|nr:MAG: DUF4276 family protein [Chloroflexota bacterium]
MRAVELTVLCEGPTEQNFVSQVLGPYLRGHRVFAKGTTLTARPSVSGVVSFETMRGAIKNDLGRRRDHQYVTTMVDLYGLRGFPDQDKRAGEPAYDRVARIEKAMATGLPSHGFIPYVQVHEFEALVLVDLDQLPREFPDSNVSGTLRNLRREIGSFASEEVDDGIRTAPSKRLIRHIPDYERLKAIAGPAICGHIGIERLRAACPHFSELIEHLQGLARGIAV